MKIYRAVFEYNNNDSNEWEQWYTETSKWYTEKYLAEQHIPLLKEFRDYLHNHYVESSYFASKKPYIEEQEIAEDFTPMKLEFIGKEFKGFEYIPYEGSRSITSQILNVSFPCMSWGIFITIGEEEFYISFSTRDIEEGNYYSVYKNEQEGSKFYKYHPVIREELLDICKEYAESILPYFKEYIEEDNIIDKLNDDDDYRMREGWERARCNEVNSTIKLLKNSHLTLADYSISRIKDEIERWAEDNENPKYTEALNKLLSFTK